MDWLNKDEKKIRMLNAFMDEISQDLTREEKRNVYEKYKDYVKAIRPVDLFYVDKYRQESPLDEKTIKKDANKFVNVFHDGLKKHELTNHHHPFFKALLEENEAIISHLDSMKQYFKKGPLKDSQKELLKGFETCLEFEKKWVKKENILFPRIEDKVPSTKPLEVMWSLHDDARGQIKAILGALKTLEDEKALNKMIGTYYYLVYGIIQKEQLILFPVASAVLEDSTMDQMYQECFQFGFSLLEKTPPKFKAVEDQEALDEDARFTSRSGELTFKQIAMVFNHLPVDITYVDKHDRVRFFNERKERHFPRNPSIIGRLVQHCHPPKSVDMVERIVETFKAGEKDEAEFHIQFRDMFLHIRYFAVRDEAGEYEGVLEVTQDISHIQGLKGEKRLLDWE